MKEAVSVRVNKEILLETKRDAKRKGFKYYSHYVEQALLHELHNYNDTQAVSELIELKEIIEEKLKRFEDNNDNEYLFDDESLDDPMHYVNEVKSICNTTGYVFVGVIDNFANKCGLTRREFLALLNRNGFDGNIMD